MDQAIGTRPEDAVYYPGAHWERVVMFDTRQRKDFWSDLERDMQ